VRQLEKVTIFVTRGAGAASEMLVFRHGRSGVQVPAGTVEAGEAPEVAAIRELAEETGLTAARLVGALGQSVDDLPQSERGVLSTEVLREAPAGKAVQPAGMVYRGMTVPCRDEADGYSLVGHVEWDLDQDPWVVLSEQWGWVPATSLCARRVRHFYHFRTTTPSPDEWTQTLPDGDQNGDFHLYWVPLVPRPDLVQPQDQWLDAYYERLHTSQ
jgi:8-oxo-dGTP pyrophosphatase MutT (NUDIX family)